MGRTLTRKPRSLRINDETFHVRTWVEVNTRLISWLVREGYLTESSLPVFNATETKILIDGQEEDRGEWREAVEGFYVDIRYSAKAHTKNIKAYLERLLLTDGDVILSCFDGEEIVLFSSEGQTKKRSEGIKVMAVPSLKELIESLEQSVSKLESELNELSGELNHQKAILKHLRELDEGRSS